MSYYYPYPYFYPFQYYTYSPLYYGGFYPSGHSPYDFGPHFDFKGLDRHYLDPHIDYHGPKNWPTYYPYYYY